MDELLNAGLGLLERGDRALGIGKESRIAREARAAEACNASAVTATGR